MEAIAEHRVYEVTTLEGLRLAGFENARSGTVWLKRPMPGRRSTLGHKRSKFRFLRRAGDGHCITAAGRLVGAEVTEVNGRVAWVQFYVEKE